MKVQVFQDNPNKLDFKTSNGLSMITVAKQGLGGIQEDSKVAKKMVMCFHFVEAGSFDKFTAVHAVASYPGGLGKWGYSIHATKHGPMHEWALHLERWWAVIWGIDIVHIIL